MLLKVTNTFRKIYKVFLLKKYRQIVSYGGSRSGKSYSILQILLLILIVRKRIKITVWRDTKVTCRSTVLEDFKKIIMFDEHIYRKFKENKQSGTFTYIPTGSKIIFEGADDIGKVLGSAQDISFFNEVTEFSYDVYLQITQRTSETVFCDYNPSKDFWLENYKYDEETSFTHTNFLDNAYCPINIVKQLLSYEPWEPGSYEVVGDTVYYRGAPISDSNQPPPHKKNVKKKTANVYMWLVYGLGVGSEKPNRVYRGWSKISEERFYQLDYTSYFGLDFGSSSPTAMLEVKFDGDRTFYVKPCLYKPGKDMDNPLSTTINKSVDNYVLGEHLIAADPAKQVLIDNLKENGHMVVKAIKGAGSVESGITLVQGFIIVYVEDEDFDREYKNYSFETDRYGKATDKPIKKNDHYMDALRYIITYLVAYLGIET